MGICSLDEVTVNAVKNWKAAVEGERRAAILWNDKWGWIVEEYRLVGGDLVLLKSKREYAEPKKHIDKRSVRPFPVTSAGEIGWLSTRPEFTLDRYGPYPYTKGWYMPLEPPEFSYEIDEEQN